MFRRIILSLALLAGALGIAHAVNVTGTDSSGKNSVVRVGFLSFSNTDTITAFAGGGQTSATQLDSGYNRVTVVATANDSVKLPACISGMRNTGSSGSPARPTGNSLGMMVVVTNADAADSMNVFPQTGEFINALTVNSAYAMAANKTAAFVCGTAGIWYSILGG